ncbi:DNA mismatch repair MutL/HexB family protein [Pleurotus pulmonarius]
MSGAAIKAIDSSSIHRITSGQVVIDLQTAVKELVENSIDAGATSIDIRFKHYGLRAIEVVDNGCGISEEDHENIALKHCTSKLSSFSDLTTVHTFGFRGEALSSLCALSESVTVTTSTKAPMGTSLDMAPSGKVKKKSKVARQRGTTINVVNLFLPLPVRRKEFERNLKREFGKAITLLTAYALVPCTSIRLSVTNHLDSGNKSVQLRTNAASSVRAAVTALWGNKALDNIVDLDLTFDVERDKHAVKRLAALHPEEDNAASLCVSVKGLISKFSVNQGRSGTDRQFFYINGRPCNLSKVQKAFNEVYRSFNATQSPFIIADFLIPTDSYDVNVSPDKRTIFLHNEANLIVALRSALEKTFSPSRSTFDINNNSAAPLSQQTATASPSTKGTPLASKERPGSSKRTTLESGEGEGGEDDGGHDSDIGEEIPMTNDKPKTPSPPTPSRIPAPQRRPQSVSPPLPPSSASQPPISVLEDDREVSTVVLDTTKAVWSQGAARSPRELSPLENGGDDDGDDEAVDDLDAVHEEPPRKKQRRMISAAPALVQRKIKDMFRQPGDASDSASSPRATRKDAAKSNSPNVGGAHDNARRDVVARPVAPVKRRSRLLDYMMPGSQGLADPLVDADMDEGGENEGGEEHEAGATALTSDNIDIDELRSTSPPADVTSIADAMDIDDAYAEETPPQRDPLFLDSPKPDLVDLTDDSLFDDDISTLDGPDSSLLTPSQTSSSTPILRPEVIRSNTESGDVTLRFDFARISQVWLDLRDRLVDACAESPDMSEDSEDVEMGDAGITNVDDEAGAIRTLTRVIEKQDFAKMLIVGQFNLGFIIVRRRKSRSRLCGVDGVAGLDGGANYDADAFDDMDDLFIVDQHAADEKYNFEQLQETTKIKSQRLFKPLTLELTAADELVALENIDVLRSNGFDVVAAQDDEGNASDSSSSPTRRRLQLVAQPVSKDTVFGVKDLEELIQLMHDHPAGQMVRPSKTRAMFAMRACRKSVMVGMPLTKRQMTTVVHHMGTMDLPWNCPHGRPTMRHLSDISSVQKHSKTLSFRPIDWSRLERM